MLQKFSLPKPLYAWGPAAETALEPVKKAGDRADSPRECRDDPVTSLSPAIYRPQKPINSVDCQVYP